MSDPRWWTEPVDPDDPALHDGPVGDIDEPPPADQQSADDTERSGGE